MDSVTLFNVVLMPHTWPLFFGLPAILITGAIAGGLYELLNNRGGK